MMVQMQQYRMPLRWVLLAGTALLLAGCGPLLETEYQAPTVQAPPQWWQTAGGVSVDQVSVDPWWRDFNDPLLDRLIAEALTKNNDLASAAIKVRKARLQAGLSERAMLPSLSVDGSGQAEKTLRNTQSGSGSAGSTKGTERSYSLNGSVSYEADLWGRLSRAADATRWEAEATEQDRASTALSLTATTATLYWQVLYYQDRMRLARESIAYTQRSLDLVQAQVDSGAASPLELLQARQSVETQEAEATRIEQSLIESQTALAVLFDGPPRAMGLDELHLPTTPIPAVQAGVPSSVMARRPDIRAAELRLREALATVDAKQADYLPQLTLTGGGGSSSATLLNLLSNPVLTLGAGLTLPFLNWNEMQMNVKVSEADYQDAVVSFRQTLYAAFAEIENALSARRTYADQADRLQRALDAALQVEDIYQVRYNAGAATMQEWLDEQEKRRELQVSLLENRFNRLQAQATLYKVLGGGMGAAPQ